jgi:hypothetical protein
MAWALMATPTIKLKRLIAKCHSSCISHNSAMQFAFSSYPLDVVILAPELLQGHCTPFPNEIPDHTTCFTRVSASYSQRKFNCDFKISISFFPFCRRPHFFEYHDDSQFGFRMLAPNKLTRFRSIMLTSLARPLDWGTNDNSIPVVCLRRVPHFATP